MVVKPGGSPTRGRPPFFFMAVLGLTILLSCVSYGQEYPFLWKIEIDANVTYDSLTSMFYYDYAMTNDPKNRGEVEKFTLIIWRDSASTVAYDTSGLQFAGDTFSENTFRKDFQYLGSWIVPVGIVSLPEGWEGWEFGRQPELEVHKYAAFLKPGQSVAGIDLMSRGLPGVRECYVTPDFNVDVYLPNEENIETIDSIENSTAYVGLTVGPWAPPARFDPLVLLDTLASYIRESRGEGWITFEVVSEKYQLLLARTKKEIQRSDLKAAILSLHEVLSDAETDRTRLLKPEAYALIRYNTEYLIRQMGIRKSAIR